MHRFIANIFCVRLNEQWNQFECYVFHLNIFLKNTTGNVTNVILSKLIVKLCIEVIISMLQFWISFCKSNHSVEQLNDYLPTQNELFTCLFLFCSGIKFQTSLMHEVNNKRIIEKFRTQCDLVWINCTSIWMRAAYQFLSIRSVKQCQNAEQISSFLHHALICKSVEFIRND